MMTKQEQEYKEIVRVNYPPKYQTPEEQGASIEKCTILKPVEIEYNKLQYLGR